MPSVPSRGSITICERNREFVTANGWSENVAKDVYGGKLGIVFAPLTFSWNSTSALSDCSSAGETSYNRDDENKGLLRVPRLFTNMLYRFFHPNDVELLPKVDLQVVSWHPSKNILAFISGSNRVTVCNYEECNERDPCVLTNEIQQGVKLLDWRPNGGRTLAVACQGGVCIWSVTPSPSGISMYRRTPVDFFRSTNREQISAMSWSPSGRYLATGSYESASFIVWDVAQGVGTNVRRGVAGVSMLKWSPGGDYLLSAKYDGSFYLWETDMWTSEPWSSNSGFVKGATWGRSGSMVLVTFSATPTLGSIHFASKPPSLCAHLLPVDLSELLSLTGGESVEKVAWDGSGERLGVSYKGGDELYRGLIAIYDVRGSPLISLSLIGFVRGPGENPEPVSFSFNNRFLDGPLLTVCWTTGLCCTYPLFLRPHSSSPRYK